MILSGSNVGSVTTIEGLSSEREASAQKLRRCLHWIIESEWEVMAIVLQWLAMVGNGWQWLAMTGNGIAIACDSTAIFGKILLIHFSSDPLCRWKHFDVWASALLALEAFYGVVLAFLGRHSIRRSMQSSLKTRLNYTEFPLTHYLMLCRHKYNSVSKETHFHWKPIQYWLPVTGLSLIWLYIQSISTFTMFTMASKALQKCRTVSQCDSPTDSHICAPILAPFDCTSRLHLILA